MAVSSSTAVLEVPQKRPDGSSSKPDSFGLSKISFLTYIAGTRSSQYRTKPVTAFFLTNPPLCRSRSAFALEPSDRRRCREPHEDFASYKPHLTSHLHVAIARPSRHYLLTQPKQ